MRQLWFRALVTLYPVAPATGTPPSSPPPYPGHTVALVILACPLRADSGRARYLPTEIWRDGGTPLHPGEPALVTVKVTDDQADDFLDAGQPFTLWCGGKVGRGTVTQRIPAGPGSFPSGASRAGDTGQASLQKRDDDQPLPPPAPERHTRPEHE